MQQTENYQDKVVIVTGGAQGIGRALSQAFGQAGATVMVADQDEEALEECAAWLATQQIRVGTKACDMGSAEDVKQLIASTVERFGTVDIVVNNAGISRFKPLDTLEVEEFDRILAVNLRSVFLTAKFAAPHLRRQKGCLLNIASTRALMSEPHSEGYAASKGGIVALTHALAMSLSPDVRVNAISPGWIVTDEWQKASQRKKPELRDIDHTQHPVGRVGWPEDIAAAALYLCSPAAGFVTGQNLVVDGGMTIKMIYEE
ncbi:hypothetical protein SAMN05421823_109230 [Catalinimonas alkaloidigena]|uniref:NAD(P)-dependent dehydrogenase, short-chain alcohol dehydrogenase family n=1 Tax=Catalinimonas alkaloidigena TaxID=1075417 RepID=A0A1G9PLN4_9BACT|nr:glucose 1-dehydrogenase [Catalinimonas alkaloidigena]SDL99483.1 hypothetical protein SAMN05421823_109230 [Catalinimonas alkaloidigena]